MRGPLGFALGTWLIGNLPLPLAFSTFERRLVAAGVTTEFHASTSASSISSTEENGRGRSPPTRASSGAHALSNRSMFACPAC